MPPQQQDPDRQKSGPWSPYLLDVPSDAGTMIWDLMLAPFRLLAVSVADDLNLFEFVAAKVAVQISDLESRLGLSRRGAESLAATLAALNLLTHENDSFSLTSTGNTYLLPSSPFYIGGALHRLRDRPFTHSALKNSLLSDRGLDIETPLTKFWGAGELSPRLAEEETAFQHTTSFPVALDLANYGDFSSVGNLLDVGGGSGCFSIALALRYPHLNCTVLDLPVVCDLTENYINAFQLGHRVHTMRTHMFADEWPVGHDAIFLSNIFHDWDSERCYEICRRVYQALPSGGQIYIHEMLLNDTRSGPIAAATLSLWMVLVTEGKQLTASELTAMLVGNGFTNVSISRGSGYFSLISAHRP